MTTRKTVCNMEVYRRSRTEPFTTGAMPPRQVHGKEVVSAHLLPFPLERGHKRRPRRMRNPLALKPLFRPGLRNTDVTGHLRDGVPAIEKLRNGFHNTGHYDGDGLSRQAVATLTVTVAATEPTISRMGRAKTPIQFNRELALRLKSARIAAGYGSMPPFAKALGIELERYKKWESGRTPFQHEFLPAICDLTGKDANFFYSIEPVALPAKRSSLG